ncbi:hypothetical protein RRG08_022162 [Elysia crispata]|uniref:Uncharacterized protein n=1 Tax=Elysia crispata TaxID=231223 RepID=A0AAE1AHD2_9GAST|nr:hypothetical protein RRG08_022162 [Elysia crispata]
MAPDSLKLIQHMLTCPVELLTLKAEMSFIVQHSEAFVQATDAFQSQEPIDVKAWPKLEELHDIFGSCGVSLIQAKQHFDGDLPQSKKIVLQNKFFQAFSAVSLKLAKYVSEEGQPDICVIKQLPFFYPTRLILYSCDHISVLPGMNSVSTIEINRYRESLGPTGCQGVWGNPNQPDSILEQCKFVCS